MQHDDKDDKKIRELFNLQQYDQATAGLVQIAQIIGAYRAELLTSKVPAREVATLTRDFQRLLLARALGYPEPPMI